MRSAILVITLSLFLVSEAVAQSPDDGKVTGNSYVNSYFHMSYAWPKFLQPYDTSALHLPPKSPYENEFLLFSARQGEEPFGVVVLAERLNAVTPHSRGLRDGADLLDRIMKGFKPEEHEVTLSRRHFTSEEGIVFDEVDYTDLGGYESGVAAQIGQFVILFKCNAKSANDLAEMTRSASALRLVK
jgi:hypothetical protein